MDAFDVPIVLALFFSVLTLVYGRSRRWSAPHLALGAMLGFFLGPIPIVVSLARERLQSSTADNG